jgi:ADP-ribose pyrophosphatase
MPGYIWKFLRSEDLVRTPYHRLVKDRLLHPSGRELDYYVLRANVPAVGVVPVADDGSVLMVRQWRHTVQKLSWEIPAGAQDPGEDPAASAARELVEETGYTARSVRPLYSYHPTIGMVEQTFNLFAATGLHQSGHHDPDEILDVRFVPRPEIEAMLAANEITDGMTLTALLLWLAGR